MTALGLLAIRTDGDAAIGLGHAMRCYALAERWRMRGGEALLRYRRLPEAVLARCAAAGVAAEPLPPGEDTGSAFAADAARRGAAWLVVDGPAFGPGYLADAASVLPTLAIDDGGLLARYPVHLLLNQNLHAEPGIYRGKTAARLLIGPAYALLRSDIAEAPRRERLAGEPARRVLVLVGGADPGGFLGRLADAAARGLAAAGIAGGEVRAVIGPANPWRPAPDAAGGPVRFVAAPGDLAELMRWADLAVSSAGSTVWELSLHGVPMLLGASVPIEQAVGAAMAGHGGARYLGRLDDLDAGRLAAEVADLLRAADERAALSAAARALVDGKGADRVIDAMIAGRPAERGSAEQ